MKPCLPALFALLCILCHPTSALPAKRWEPESCSLAEAKSALVRTGSYECLAFLAVLVSQASLLPAVRMSARLCSDSDHSPLCCTFYRLILGKQNSVELSLYSTAQSFPIPAMRRTTRRWCPTGRHKKPKFTRVVSLPPRAAKMSLWPSLYLTLEVRFSLVTVSLLPGFGGWVLISSTL